MCRYSDPEQLNQLDLELREKSEKSYSQSLQCCRNTVQHKPDITTSTHQPTQLLMSGVVMKQLQCLCWQRRLRL
ncbi:hypothetical protein AOLI_G00049110 [Acnodon oligacanthus]